MGWEVEWPTSDNNLLMLPIFPIPRVAAEKFDAKLVIGAKTGRVFGQKIACFRPFSIEIIKTFLKAGANPNPVYDDGDTLMHKLACKWPSRRRLVKMLLDAGSHNIDVVNSKGDTALDIFKRKQLERDGNPDAFLQTLTKNVLPLQCQCAVVIRRNRIPFDELHPPIILSFVKNHKSFQNTHHN